MYKILVNPGLIKSKISRQIKIKKE